MASDLYKRLLDAAQSVTEADSSNPLFSIRYKEIELIVFAERRRMKEEIKKEIISCVDNIPS